MAEPVFGGSTAAGSLAQLPLIESLRNAQMDLKKLIKDFDELPKEDAVRIIIVALFRCAGILSFTDESYENLDNEEISRLASLEVLHVEPDILLKDFQQNLLCFLNGYFAINLPLLWSSSGELMTAIAVAFMKGRSDSFRMMAATLGVKITSAIIMAREINAATTYEAIEQLCNSWAMLHQSVFEQGMRDGCPDVVQIILSEFSLWTSLNIRMLKDPDVFNCIRFGLRLKNSLNRKTCFDILFQVFSKTLNKTELSTMFRKVRMPLIKILVHDFKFEKIVSLKIFCILTEKEIDFDLTEAEKFNIYLALRNPSRLVRELVARFFIFNLLKNTDSNNLNLVSKTLIEGIIALIDTYRIKEFPLLADTFAFIFTEKSSRDVWVLLLRSTTSSTAVELFYAVVERLVTNQVPENTSAGYNPVSETDSKVFCEFFSQSFSTWWFEVFKFMSGQMSSSAKLKMIDIVKFVKKEADPRLWLKIAFELINKFFELSDDDELVQESFKMVLHVYYMLESSTRAKELLLSFIREIVQIVVGYFKKIAGFKSLVLHDLQGEVMSSQIIAVSRYAPFDDNDDLWNLAIKEIQENGIDYQNNAEFTLLLIHILFGRFFSLRVKIDELKKTMATDVPGFQLAVNSWIVETHRKFKFLKLILTPLLQRNIPKKIQVEVSQYFAKSIVVLGSHDMDYHSYFFNGCFNFDEGILQKFQSTVTMTMAPPCKDDEICCYFVWMFSEMIRSGIIPVEHSEIVLEHLGHNDLHDDLVIDAIKKLLRISGMNMGEKFGDIFHSILLKRVESQPNPESFCENLLNILFVKYKLDSDILFSIHKISIVSKNRVVARCLVKTSNGLSLAAKIELCTLLRNTFNDSNLPENVVDYTDLLKLISEPLE